MLEFCYPVTPWKNCKIDAGFLDPAYFAERKSHHNGIDINLKSGGNTDLGYPLRSMFPGVVTYAGWPNSGKSSYGRVVLIRAEDWVRSLVAIALDTDVPVLEVQYAHLQHICVTEGQRLNAGEPVGSMGGSGGNYLSHLHMSVRRRNLAPNDPQGGKPEDKQRIQAGYIDPKRLFDVLPFSDHPTALCSERLHTFVTDHLWVDGEDKPLKYEKHVVIKRSEESKKLFVKPLGG